MREPFNAATWLVDRRVDAGDGDRLAVICEDQRYTYRELAGEIERTAAALRALGVRPEERVAMAVLDSVDYVAVFLGALRIGAVPVPMNPMLPGRDLGVITADARATVAVVSGAVAGCIGDLCSGAPEVATVVVTGEVPLDAASSDARILSWDEFTSGADGADSSPYPTWDESPGFWLCTSGSTGQPKLAMHRHIDIRVTCETYARSVLDITPEDRFYSVGPMFHAYGLGNSLTFAFSVGASTILEPSRPPTPARVAEIVTAHRPTLFFCIPTFYAALNSSDLATDTFASVRLGVSAAEPLPAETFERFRERFGVTVLDGIGSTEMLHIYLSNSPADLRPGTSGKPVDGYEVRVVDDDGQDQPIGEPGQLLVTGQSMTTGYWCQSEINQATFDGPWMRTGDLYAVDGDGYHAYLGRVDDMLRVGGEWVSPAEVEATLISHPAVLEAAVVGEHDAGGVLRPVAHVIRVDGVDTGADDLASELTAFCRERLAGYKRPRRYEFVDNLPKTATGKIQRFKLRT